MDRDSLIKYITATIAGGDAQTSPEGYDVEGIADELEQFGGGAENIDASVFWATVQKHQKHQKTS